MCMCAWVRFRQGRGVGGTYNTWNKAHKLCHPSDYKYICAPSQNYPLLLCVQVHICFVFNARFICVFFFVIYSICLQGRNWVILRWGRRYL